jgi:hypothetical protein
MRTLLMAAMVAVSACAAPMAQPEPAPPPAFDPVGVYDFTTQVEGSAVTGTLDLRRNAQGVLSAQISTQVTGTMTATATLDGRKVEMRASTEQGDLAMQFTVAEDNTIAGSWSLASGMSGTLTGARRRT